MSVCASRTTAYTSLGHHPRGSSASSASFTRHDLTSPVRPLPPLPRPAPPLPRVATSATTRLCCAGQTWCNALPEPVRTADAVGVPRHTCRGTWDQGVDVTWGGPLTLPTTPRGSGTRWRLPDPRRTSSPNPSGGRWACARAHAPDPAMRIGMRGSCGGLPARSHRPGSGDAPVPG